MKRDEYFQLRNKMYNTVEELEPNSEHYQELFHAYDAGCNMLDYVDDLGYKLKYLDPETNHEMIGEVGNCPKCNSINFANEDDSNYLTCHDCSFQWEE